MIRQFIIIKDRFVIIRIKYIQCRCILISLCRKLLYVLYQLLI